MLLMGGPPFSHIERTTFVKSGDIGVFPLLESTGIATCSLLIRCRKKPFSATALSDATV